MSASKVVKLLRLARAPCLQQLHYEEALYRGGKGNWCLFNDGVAAPAIVMGISGKPDELIHTEAAVRQGVQVIQRFTGGGTVVVDHNTLMVSLVFEVRVFLTWDPARP